MFETPLISSNMIVFEQVISFLYIVSVEPNITSHFDSDDLFIEHIYFVISDKYVVKGKQHAKHNVESKMSNSLKQK